MKEKQKYILYFLIIVTTILSIYSLTISLKNKQSVAYIDLTELFDEFTYKKELLDKLKGQHLKIDAKIDSLSFFYDSKVMVFQQQENVSQENYEELQKLAYELNNLEQDLIMEKDSIRKHYDELIWSQINQYMEEFGEKSNYEIIFGVNGTGNIMYGKKSSDITKEAIVFINGAYIGE